MSGDLGVPVELFLAGALLMFLLELGLSVALVATNALSRVALHRLSAETDGMQFLAGVQEPLSTHRIATLLLRQLSLLGAALLSALAARQAGWSHPAVAGVTLACLAGAVAIEGVVARGIALWDPRRALRATAALMRAACVLLYPLALLVARALAGFGHAAVNGEDDEEEVEALIEVGEREGLLEAEEGAMMRGIVDLDETRVREIMTPRTDIVAIPAQSTVDQARRRLLEAGHSRLPVYRDRLDNVIGVLHARDLIRAWEDHEDHKPITAYLRPVIHVPESMSAAQLLSEMRTKTKIAMVVDEFGGVSGLVTLEDVLEEIVGDIRDEHEQDEEEPIQAQDDGSYIVKAVTHVEELVTLFGVDLGERDFDTVGGLVVSAFGRVPAEGESIDTHGMHVTVLQAGRRRILRVQVSRSGRDSEAGAGA